MLNLNKISNIRETLTRLSRLSQDSDKTLTKFWQDSLSRLWQDWKESVENLARTSWEHSKTLARLWWKSNKNLRSSKIWHSMVSIFPNLVNLLLKWNCFFFLALVGSQIWNFTLCFYSVFPPSDVHELALIFRRHVLQVVVI